MSALQEPSADLAIIDQTGTLIQDDPEVEVEWASRCAKTLVRAITGNPQLTATISGRQYLKVEAWQTLGAMTKVDDVRVVWCREYVPPGAEKHTGWEARVEIRDRAGNLRATGEAQCDRSDKTWAGRDEFAIRSMAQTRAVGKAYRMALSYVVSLAGYEPTPAEEMPGFPTPEEIRLLALADELDVRAVTEAALSKHRGDSAWISKAIVAAEKNLAAKAEPEEES